MTLFQIDSEIFSLIDHDTGEVKDYEAFLGLQMERERKIENVLLLSKENSAEAVAIKAEIDALTERKASAERKAKKLLELAETALAGQPYKTPRVEVKYRKSSSVEIEDEGLFVEWAEKTAPDMLTYKAPSISKKAIGDAIKSGATIPFASLVERNNMRVI